MSLAAVAGRCEGRCACGREKPVKIDILTSPYPPSKVAWDGLCTADHGSVRFVRSVAVMSVLVMSTTA